MQHTYTHTDNRHTSGQDHVAMTKLSCPEGRPQNVWQKEAITLEQTSHIPLGTLLGPMQQGRSRVGYNTRADQIPSSTNIGYVLCPHAHQCLLLLSRTLTFLATTLSLSNTLWMHSNTSCGQTKLSHRMCTSTSCSWKNAMLPCFKVCRVLVQHSYLNYSIYTFQNIMTHYQLIITNTISRQLCSTK